MGILDRIKTSSDVKSLSVKELKILAEELRSRIIGVTGDNGGHLASNLGVVETTVALHYVFGFPADKLIFDVGHQCYAHKMLSERNDRFDTIRTCGGISGFPNKCESVYDTFTVGHAGTSLASGLGLCAARDAKGEDYYVINIVGDGSFVNGLNLEAMYAKDFKPKKFIVILNDNGMSISRNKNGFYKFLSRRSIGKGYRAGKGAIKKIFRNSFITKFLRKVRNGMKRLFNSNNHFEYFGFKYVGPVDGNDIEDMVRILRNVKIAANDKAVFLHVKTTKGKGLEAAEEHSELYHGVGKNLQTNKGAFSTALGNKLNDIISADGSVVVITAGMKDGTGLTCVEKEHPENFYDVGIAEEYAVTFAGGLAAGGLKPVVAVYSTFLQRAYDQILHDVCLQNLPVVFCIDRAGLVGADGATHQGVYDLSYLSHMPNMAVFTPTTVAEFESALCYALSLGSPTAIRYPNDKTTYEREVDPFDRGLWETFKNGSDISVLAVGPRMLKLGSEFAEKSDKSVRVISARTVKPLDTELLNKIKDKPIITLEENSVIGGFGSAVMQYYAEAGIPAVIIPFGVKDKFIEHGSVEEQLADNGLTVENLMEKTKNL